LSSCMQTILLDDDTANVLALGISSMSNC